MQLTEAQSTVLANRYYSARQMSEASQAVGFDVTPLALEGYRTINSDTYMDQKVTLEKLEELGQFSLQHDVNIAPYFAQPKHEQDVTERRARNGLSTFVPTVEGGY